MSNRRSARPSVYRDARLGTRQAAGRRLVQTVVASSTTSASDSTRS